MSEMKHEVWIKAEKSEIYNSFATIDGIKGWWTSKIDFNKEKRTLKFSFFEGKHWMKFKILETKKNNNVKWECIETDANSGDWLGTEITISVDEVDGNKRVNLVHSKWKQDSKIFAMCNSTWGHLMFSLKNYLETGEGNPMS